MSKSRSFSIYLLKEGKDATNSLKEERLLDLRRHPIGMWPPGTGNTPMIQKDNITVDIKTWTQIEWTSSTK